MVRLRFVTFRKMKQTTLICLKPRKNHFAKMKRPTAERLILGWLLASDELL